MKQGGLDKKCQRSESKAKRSVVDHDDHAMYWYVTWAWELKHFDTEPVFRAI